MLIFKTKLEFEQLGHSQTQQFEKNLIPFKISIRFKDRVLRDDAFKIPLNLWTLK